MRSKFRPWLVIGLFELAVAAVAAQEAAPPPAAAGVAATVNGQPIAETAVQRALRRVPPDRHAQARPEIVAYLVDNALIDQYLTQTGAPVDAREVDQRFEQIRGEIAKAGQDFAKVLQELNLSEAELKGQISADLRWEKFASQRATEPALRALFDKNLAQFDGSTVHARHILVTAPQGDAQASEQAKAQLQLLRKQIDDQVAQGMQKVPADADPLTREKERVRLLDEAFAAAAREKSACPSKANGGDVGSFPRSGSMVEPFARAAFDLKPYQLSDVVTTQFGHHLILVTERRPGKDVKFADIQNEVREAFYDHLREDLVAQLRQRAQIVITPVKP